MKENTIATRRTLSCHLWAFYLFMLKQSQLSYSKGTWWELGCNYNIFLHTIYHWRRKQLLCLMTESMSKLGAGKAKSEQKDPAWLFIVLFDVWLQSYYSFWSWCAFGFYQHQSLGKPPAACGLFGVLILFCISSCQKWLQSNNRSINDFINPARGTWLWAAYAMQVGTYCMWIIPMYTIHSSEHHNT